MVGECPYRTGLYHDAKVCILVHQVFTLLWRKWYSLIGGRFSFADEAYGVHAGVIFEMRAAKVGLRENVMNGVVAMGQSTPAQAPQPQKATSKPAPAPAMKEETVEGFWSVAGYLGGKLLRETGNRMNLDGSKE
jgi:hypothetical protein